MGFLGRILNSLGLFNSGNQEFPVVSVEQSGNVEIKTFEHPNGQKTTTISCIPPKVNGIPTYELAKTHKDDIDIMLQCCNAEMNNYKKTGEQPAPFYFSRVAILARKAKNYLLEIKICEEYLSAVEEFRKSPGFDPRFPGIVASPRVAELKKRLPKARELLSRYKEQ